MAIVWDDYKHLFGTFTAEDTVESNINLPAQLDRSFELHFHVSNVGPVKLRVPPRHRHLRSLSDDSVRGALACFASASHMVQMEGTQEGWMFSAVPFRAGLPCVQLHTDRAYTLQSCVLDEQNQPVSALFDQSREAA